MCPKSDVQTSPRHMMNTEDLGTRSRGADCSMTNQEVFYNYKADLHGTGNRSILD